MSCSRGEHCDTGYRPLSSSYQDVPCSIDGYQSHEEPCLKSDSCNIPDYYVRNTSTQPLELSLSTQLFHSDWSAGCTTDDVIDISKFVNYSGPVEKPLSTSDSSVGSSVGPGLYTNYVQLESTSAGQ